MKRRILALLVILFAFGYNVSSVRSQDDAMVRARAIWEDFAVVRMAGRNYQVGCIAAGDVHVISSKISYDDALSKVNLQLNGRHMISAVVTDTTTGETATSDPVSVILCNP